MEPFSLLAPRVIFRGGNAEKWTFDWIIVPSKYGSEIVEWAGGFNKKYWKFNSGH